MDQEDEIPIDFRCPILLCLMKDPVITVDGHTFERKAVQEWFNRGNMTNPKTGAELSSTKLFPNISLKNMISKYRETKPSLPKNPPAQFMSSELQITPEILQEISNKISQWEQKFDKKLPKVGEKKDTIYGQYFGQIKGGVREGMGIMNYWGLQVKSQEDNLYEKYKGEWKDGVKQGLGICYYKNGDRYEGQWENNAQEGIGFYYWDDKMWGGRWKNGVSEGKGLVYLEIGTFPAQWNQSSLRVFYSCENYREYEGGSISIQDLEQALLLL